MTFTATSKAATATDTPFFSTSHLIPTIVCFMEDSKMSKRSHLCQGLQFSLQETNMLP